MAVLYYILKLSVCLIIIWAFYQLVLRRLTFYNWNRLYLVVCPALAFLLPLINISPLLEKNNWTKTPIVSAIPPLPGYKSVVVTRVSPTFGEQFLNWLPYIVAAGALVMLTRLLLQYFSLLAIRRSSQLLLNGPVKVYQVNKSVIPFSFGNAIFLNQHLHEEEELKEIIRHEFIHVKQRHTIDIIWSELICILTWYNPFSWLLRKAVRQNLEFIADQQVLKTGLDRRQYQYLLLKVIGVPTYSIASNFNFKSLKKRIAMMNKVKSARLHLIRFALLLPVVAILLVASRNAAKHRQQPPAVVSVNDTTGPVKKGFPENVRSFHHVDNQVTVTLKNGKVEVYNINNEDELLAFEKKYGKLPAPPPPPEPSIVEMPAPHPAPHAFALAAPAPDPLAPPIADEFDYYELVPTQDDCYNDKGYCLTVVGTQKGAMVIVLHKSKREAELVYLEDWRKDKKYEQKFGKLPPASPPPPVTPPAPVEYDIPEGVSEVHVKNYDAVVKTVDGKVERYDLRVAEEKAAYESKYGRQPGKVEYVAGMVETIEKKHVDKFVTIPSKVRVEVGNIEEIKEIPGYAPHVKVGNVSEPVGEQEILAVITNKTTTAQLEQLKSELKAKGITMQITDKHERDGIIKNIQGSMNNGSSKTQFSATDFERITLSRDGKKGKGLYIYINDITEHK